MTRSRAATKRRGASVARVLSGTKVACETCKLLHKPPVCHPLAESVQFCVVLPPHVDREMRECVEWGERSTWIVGLIRRELDV